MRNLDGDWEVTDSKGRQVSFNFCTYAEATSSGCSNEAFGFEKAGGKCLELTGSEPQAEVNESVTKSDKDGKDMEGIRLNRGGGAECPDDPSQLLGLTMDVWCNPDVLGAPD